MKGFTLIELLIAAAIFTGIIAGIFGILYASNLSWDSNLGTLALAQDARQAMDGMTRELRQSDPDQVTLVDGGARINFFVPGIAVVISYYVQDNQLIREYPVGTLKVLANNISDVTFAIDSDMLTIQINASKNTIRNRFLSFSLVERVKLRN